MNIFLLVSTAVAVLALAYLLLFRACIKSRCKRLDKERDGIGLSRALKDLLHDLQQHRGTCNAYLSGDDSFAGKIETLQQAINAKIKNLNELFASSDSVAWPGLVQTWQALARDVRQFEAGESFVRHTRLIQHMLELLSEVGELSGLVMDEAVEAQQLADALVHHLPMMTELLGQSRALGASAAAQGRASSVTAMRLQFLSEQVKDGLGLINVAVERIAQGHGGTRLRSEYQGTAGQIGQFLNTIDEHLIGRQHIDIAPDAYFRQATQVIDANYRLFDAMQPELMGMLDQRQGMTRRRLNMMTMTIVGVLALCITAAGLLQ